MLQVYIEDALGDRIWVDLDSCKELVANICTLFGTKACGGVGGIGGGGGAGSGGGAGGASGVGGGKNTASDSKASSSESTESLASDVGELSKEALLSGIETVPRFALMLCDRLRKQVCVVV